jgi:hypothetical protein
MNNQWQKRQTTLLSCPSGNEVIVRRTGPDLAVKAGKFARVLQKVSGKNGKATPDEQLAAIEQLPDKELEQLMAFARVVLADVVVNPPLYLNPREGQLSPDDVPLNDFWYIHTWAMNGGPTLPVKLKEGETTVEAVSNFPDGRESDVDTRGDSETVQ